MNVDVHQCIVPVAGLLRMLAEPNRLRIICVLTEDCQHVQDIVQATGLAQPLVSHHLRVLKEHGIVKSERQGGFTTYCFARPSVVENILQLCDVATELALLHNPPVD